MLAGLTTYTVFCLLSLYPLIQFSTQQSLLKEFFVSFLKNKLQEG